MSLGAGIYYVNKATRNYFVEQNFKEISLKNLEAKELKRLYRAYQIKKSEIEEDKKALAKYKYDP